MSHRYDITPLLEPQASFVIPLLDYIPRLQDRYADYFIPPEPGIYLMNGLTPLLKSGHYFSESSYKRLQPIHSLDNLQEAVLDDNGTVLIPRYVMRHKAQFLSAIPKVPVRAIQTAYLLIQIHLCQQTCHEWHRVPTQAITQYIQPQYRHLVLYEDIEDICHSLIRLLDDFINGRRWHIYFTTLHHTDVIVERAEDFRIVDWMRQQQELQDRATQRDQTIHCMLGDSQYDIYDTDTF